MDSSMSYLVDPEIAGIPILWDATVGKGELLITSEEPYRCSEGHDHWSLPVLNLVFMDRENKEFKVIIPTVSPLGSALLSGSLTLLCSITLDSAL